MGLNIFFYFEWLEENLHSNVLKVRHFHYHKMHFYGICRSNVKYYYRIFRITYVFLTFHLFNCIPDLPENHLSWKDSPISYNSHYLKNYIFEKYLIFNVMSFQLHLESVVHYFQIMGYLFILFWTEKAPPLSVQIKIKRYLTVRKVSFYLNLDRHQDLALSRVYQCAKTSKSRNLKP